MNKSLPAAAAIVALAAIRSAGAADFPMGPIYAPPPLPGWTGIYAGGHLGAAWDHRDATIFSPTGIALASGSTGANSVVGGGQIGVNYSFGAWVFGAEADLSGSDLRSSAIGGSGFGQRDNKIDAFGTVRGRLGYAWDNWLLYGTAGFAWAREQITRTQLVGTINNATPGTVESASRTGTGWTAGAGLEWSFARNWSARIEYLHLDLGAESFSFPLAMQRIDAKAQIDIARFGINFRPGWGL
jgi:outer membrane immunogenic protein